jgi:hypothetical protein
MAINDKGQREIKEFVAQPYAPLGTAGIIYLVVIAIQCCCLAAMWYVVLPEVMNYSEEAEEEEKRAFRLSRVKDK